MPIHTLHFAPAACAPNHPRWPVILYLGAIPADEDAARAFETRFAAHGWQGGWRGEVYPYVHYHAHAHEVLGVARGRARLRLGAEAGRTVEVGPGDGILLPAGTAHQCLSATADFEVVAAYPPGQSPDLQTAPATEAQRRAIADLPAPPTDPLLGTGGAVAAHWAGHPPVSAGSGKLATLSRERLS
ncbi:cupin domain-containing protein [Verticiella sediminum]|uniref:Cupin domain-containing protein n=1 Tax=Verticiella sediminum TaxID=1247510 RepID=A0A556AKD6_9BURK|nr:cupin domain-containing protein [Verticiella sediminum]TSH93358.1 cupin domain-containing protein [Verticiella sediminum]